MELFRAINTLNKAVAFVLALVVCFTQSFGRGCMYALLFFLGAFVIQMVMALVNRAHQDSAIESLQLMTGEPPDYMKHNIVVATLLLVGLNLVLAVWIFS